MPQYPPASLDAREMELLAQARGFRERVVEPRAGLWEKDRRVPTEALREAGEQGFLRLEAPRSAGGLGHRYRVKLALAEEMARGDMAFTFSLVNSQNVAARLAASTVPRHREEYLPALFAGKTLGATALTEIDAGSDFAAIRTRARRVDGGWVLNGEKAWITNASVADLFLVYAQTDPAAGRRGIACFLVDARNGGFERSAPYALLGGHAIGTGGFTLRDCVVPDSDLVRPAGEGFGYAMHGINGARIYVAAMCAGLIAASLRVAVAYASRRSTFGKPVLEHQGVNWSLGTVANDLEALRGLIWPAGEALELNREVVTAAAHAKKFAGRVTLPAVAACIQAMGAAGLSREYPLARHLACAKIAAFTDGSTEMMSQRIGTELLRRYAGDPDPTAVSRVPPHPN